MDKLLLGMVGQWLACVLLGVGIASMFFHKWNIADTIITVGSVLFSAATKLKLWGYELREYRNGRKERKKAG